MGALQVFLAVFWAVALAVMVTVNWVSVMSRSKELGSLRIMGATKRMLTAMLLKENLLVSLTGGVLGLDSARRCCDPLAMPFKGL